MENVKVHLKKITLKVTSEHVDGAGVVAGAKNSQYSAILRVEFVNWDGLTKYATFKNSKGENSVLVVFTLDTRVEENIYEIPIPPEAMTEEGMMIITFTGYEDNEGQLGSLANTATAYLRVLPSDAVFDDGSVTKNVAAQLQSEIDHLETEYLALPERVNEAAQYANNAYNSKIDAATSAENAATSEATALLYKNQAQSIYNNVEGGFVVCGSVEFSDLPDLEDCSVGWLYEIKDDFESTSDFEEGAGVEHIAGTHVYKTKNDKWAVSVSEIAVLQSDVEQLQSDMTDAFNIFAPTFSPLADYGVGQYVIYQGKEYRFWTAHTAGAWNSSEVHEVKSTGQYVTAGQEVNTTLGSKATAEGEATTASGYCSHAEGWKTKAIGRDSHAEGAGAVANEIGCHAEGLQTEATGEYSHAEGYQTNASGHTSHAEGKETTASGNCSHAEGKETTASGVNSHAEGSGTTASSDHSHAEGYQTTASEYASHAEGNSTNASEVNTHAEGFYTTASGSSSHAEGYETTASGDHSHAEGYQTTASGENSHAEGNSTNASGINSHAEGYDTTASGNISHAEGSGTQALHVCSHAEGDNTKTGADCQHVQGKYNVGKTTTLFEIGKGTSNARSNALEVDYSGNLKATSYSNYSSRRYKKNIEDMTEEQAREILKLNPVKYDYIADDMPNGQFGLIAEDVEEIMTYPIVYEDGKADSIDYSRFVPALIKMVQILQREIDELRR